MISQFKTAVFKAHNPSKTKIADIRDISIHFHNLCRQTLDRVMASSEIREQVTQYDRLNKKTGERIPLKQPKVDTLKLYGIVCKLVPMGGKTLEDRSISSAYKDGVADSVSGVLASFWQKENKGKNKCNPPTFHSLDRDGAIREHEELVSQIAGRIPGRDDLDPEDEQALQEMEAFGSQHTGIQEYLESCFKKIERQWFSILTSNPEPKPPVPPSIIASRNFQIFRRDNKCYLAVKGFESKNRRRKFHFQDGDKNLFSTDKTVKIDLTSNDKFSGLVFPLEFGREFQDDRFLQKAVGNKSLKIVLTENNEIFFHIAFEFQTEEIQTTKFIGIDKGYDKIGTASLISETGDVLQSLNLDGIPFKTETQKERKEISENQSKGKKVSKKDYISVRRNDIELHRYANDVIRLAVQHKARLVVEDLNLSKMVNRGRWKRVRSRMGKLESILNYKAALAGLPEPLKISAAYTSQTCMCGHQQKENRGILQDGK